MLSCSPEDGSTASHWAPGGQPYGHRSTACRSTLNDAENNNNRMTIKIINIIIIIIIIIIF
jgi:hypothetical protein